MSWVGPGVWGQAAGFTLRLTTLQLRPAPPSWGQALAQVKEAGKEVPWAESAVRTGPGVQ